MNSIALKNKIIQLISPILLNTNQYDDLFWKNTEEIRVNNIEIKYLIHSSFNVIYVENNSIKGYFRECRVHKKPIDFISDLINDYFTFVSKNNNYLALREELINYLGIRENLKLFMNMGVKNDPQSGFSHFLSDPSKTEYVGIPNFHSKELDNELPKFLQFVWGELYTYKLCEGLYYDHYQVFSANRQIATYKLSLLLGNSKIIPNTRYIKLHLDNGVKYGTFMDVAPGVSPEEMKEHERKCISPLLQREFLYLNTLDILCRQTDHRPGHDGNYNVSVNDKGEVDGVCAFDNDAPTSFFVTGKIDFRTSARTTSFITNKNEIDRPYFPKELAELIIGIKTKNIDILLADNLTLIQRHFIKKRLKKLKKALTLSIEKKSILLLDKDMWSYETIKSEIDYCKNAGCVSYLYSYYELIY